MPRPTMGRWMHGPPIMQGFRPFGLPHKTGIPIELLLEEYEAIKLADYENLTQEQGANKMGVSRPTFTRIYDRARKKIAKAFVEGLPILITGGNVKFKDKWYRCIDCNRVFKLPDNQNMNSKEQMMCPFCESTNTIPIEKLCRCMHNKFHR